MSPPETCSKVSTRSTVDNESDIENNGNCDSSKPEETFSIEKHNSQEKSQSQPKAESVSIVKSILGPSLEDAVLRTLEFGKSLILNKDESEAASIESKLEKQLRKRMKEKADNRGQLRTECKEGDGNMKCDQVGERTKKKRIVFTAKLDKEPPTLGKIQYSKKPGSLSKIRSLDSDLKQTAPSPEKIKRQLEALIQINKDEPPEHAPWSKFPNKTPKIPMNVTVMPTMCIYRNEANFNCSSTCDVQTGRKVTLNNEGECSSTPRFRGNNCSPRRRIPPGPISHAPEFISSALGPTLDVSIIDNIKMMRNLFKCDSGKGECKPADRPNTVSIQMQNQIQRNVKGSTSKSECEMKQRIADLEKRIEELQRKEQCLITRIDQEEKERECKRKAFEVEERMLNTTKLCIDDNECIKGECSSKYDILKQRIISEEEKLSRLKDQYECYRRELIEAKNKKDALRRNKSLLDAWDVIASRVCHTRLPSFSRAYNLERKQLQGDDASNLHCCFTGNEESNKTGRSRSRSRGSSCCRSRSQGLTRRSKSIESCKHESHPDVPSCLKVKQLDSVPFPFQRDITCGLHQCLKTCNCRDAYKSDPMTSTSDDELLKKCVDTRNGKSACRSRSDTTMKQNRCSKIVKVMWAVTRINIFQDNCRTYEVMDASPKPPPCTTGKTEGIFVVKNPKLCEGNIKKKLHPKDRC